MRSRGRLRDRPSSAGRSARRSRAKSKASLERRAGPAKQRKRATVTRRCDRLWIEGWHWWESHPRRQRCIFVRYAERNRPRCSFFRDVVCDVMRPPRLCVTRVSMASRSGLSASTLLIGTAHSNTSRTAIWPSGSACGWHVVSQTRMQPALSSRAATSLTTASMISGVARPRPPAAWSGWRRPMRSAQAGLSGYSQGKPVIDQPPRERICSSQSAVPMLTVFDIKDGACGGAEKGRYARRTR